MGTHISLLKQERKQIKQGPNSGRRNLNTGNIQILDFYCSGTQRVQPLDCNQNMDFWGPKCPNLGALKSGTVFGFMSFNKVPSGMPFRTIQNPDLNIGPFQNSMALNHLITWLNWYFDTHYIAVFYLLAVYYIPKIWWLEYFWLSGLLVKRYFHYWLI